MKLRLLRTVLQMTPAKLKHAAHDKGLGLVQYREMLKSKLPEDKLQVLSDMGEWKDIPIETVGMTIDQLENE